MLHSSQSPKPSGNIKITPKDNILNERLVTLVGTLQQQVQATNLILPTLSQHLCCRQSSPALGCTHILYGMSLPYGIPNYVPSGGGNKLQNNKGLLLTVLVDILLKLVRLVELEIRYLEEVILHMEHITCFQIYLNRSVHLPATTSDPLLSPSPSLTPVCHLNSLFIFWQESNNHWFIKRNQCSKGRDNAQLHKVVSAPPPVS
ncbi:hypothetical protein QVD17_36179 [Tagetes erecta]|uniref:Uncharacterized protein n=1 Tax=Tagetes erecta TaxID=13708 RepID=A0AAD8NBP2_TARER|nr:hypothetical protein QVD17_36179 [Tagetes erecta]